MYESDVYTIEPGNESMIYDYTALFNAVDSLDNPNHIQLSKDSFPTSFSSPYVDFKKELWFPKLLDRSYYKSWKEKGGIDMEHHCRVHKNEILKNYQPEPLSNDIIRELDHITEKAKNNLGT